MNFDNLKIVNHRQSRLIDDIFIWLQGCDLLITVSSFLSVEALIFGVPVITMDLF